MKKIFYFSIILTIFLFLPTSTYAAIYQGIDVSNWQGHINYSAVKSAGIEVVYIKATQGNSIIDSQFRNNYDNAKANGLKVGLYHFLTARSVAEAEQQAEFFSSVISGTSPDCKLAMDFEVFGNLTVQEINDISFAFLRKVQELTGKEVVIYSDASNAQNTFNRELANSYPLWVAEYGVETPRTGNWSTYEGFQYSDNGVIPGINGYTDRDTFTESILLDATTSVNTPENTSNQISTYTVQAGNTLSQIALMYHTTVGEIAGLNRIQNPNLIYVGEILKIDTTNDFATIIDDKFETNHIIYTIKPGDTLTSIAQRYNVTIQSIITLNDIINPNLIYAGTRLRINLN